VLFLPRKRIARSLSYSTNFGISWLRNHLSLSQLRNVWVWSPTDNSPLGFAPMALLLDNSTIKYSGISIHYSARCIRSYALIHCEWKSGLWFMELSERDYWHDTLCYTQENYFSYPHHQIFSRTDQDQWLYIDEWFGRIARIYPKSFIWAVAREVSRTKMGWPKAPLYFWRTYSGFSVAAWYPGCSKARAWRINQAIKYKRSSIQPPRSR
jgi:hypothetical protein